MGGGGGLFASNTFYYPPYPFHVGAATRQHGGLVLTLTGAYEMTGAHATQDECKNRFQLRFTKSGCAKSTQHFTYAAVNKNDIFKPFPVGWSVEREVKECGGMVTFTVTDHD